MSKQHANLEQLGKRILSASRDELYLSMRFFDAAFSALSFEMNLNTRFLGTDGAFVYFNPSFLMKHYQENAVAVNRCFLHMVFHCLFRHMSGREEREEEMWNLACDIAVESLIDSMQEKAVQALVPEARMLWYERLHKKLRVLTAEGIYYYLKEQHLPVEELLTLEQLFLVDDHQFFEAPQKEDKKQKNKDSEENSNNGQDKNQEESQDRQRQEMMEALARKWKQISENMKTNLETFSAEAGNRAGGLLTTLTVDNREQYDYGDFLKKFTRPREELRLDEETFDTSFYTYGLSLYGNLPLIEPLEYREEKKIEELVLVVDTSGSCQNGEVRSFLQDTFSILADSGLFTREYRIHLLQCDTVVHSDQLITNAEMAGRLQESFTMYGGGGTDFKAAFDYIKQQREMGKLKNIQGLLYFTDGYGTFPKERPDYPAAFIFWREEYEELNVPPWALSLLRLKKLT